MEAVKQETLKNNNDKSVEKIVISRASENKDSTGIN